jgi:hypothetical protein
LKCPAHLFTEPAHELERARREKVDWAERKERRKIWDRAGHPSLTIALPPGLRCALNSAGSLSGMLSIGLLFGCLSLRMLRLCLGHFFVSLYSE